MISDSNRSPGVRPAPQVPARAVRASHQGADQPLRWLMVTFVTTVCLLAAMVVFGGSARADTWAVNRDASTIAFSGTHAGAGFTGEFKTWRAEITFNPDDLASSKADVRVDLTSATTGNLTYDKTLPSADWFNTNVSSEGRFVTTDFRKTDDGAFEADGTLSLRGIDVPVTLAFTFEQNGDTAILKGKTALKRMAFDIGKGSDATGAWVSLDIPVTVHVSMTRSASGVGPKT
ncbi:MAG: YceI family protein [Pseudomonadota bacterium]